MKLDFSKFNTGALFLVRTPDVFTEGYAEEGFRDMKENLHFDFASVLETWNCFDGVIWKTDKFPRSSYWQGEERDPFEECFLAADKYNMAFLPEAGWMHEQYMLDHKDGMRTSFEGEISRYSRLGLVPSCPATLEYCIEKYDTLIEKFGHHPSFKGICMPCENGSNFSYDKYTEAAWKKLYGTALPTLKEIEDDKLLKQQVFSFMEKCYLDMYCSLAKYLKQKYDLPLMHYPFDKISRDSYHQPSESYPGGNISVMKKVEDLDLLNLQLHPPLSSNPYYFKCETEFLMANAGGKPCMADTHFFHEYAAGRLPDTTPKRFLDSIISTVTPNGISFFCYGFMREELPLWKKELNPGAPVYEVYCEPNTVKARREMCLKAMDYLYKIKPYITDTKHSADCAIYYPEELDIDYVYGSYSLEHIFGLHEIFNASAIPVKFIAHIPETPEEQKLILLDSVKTISAEDLTKLSNYLKNGGKVVIIGKCCKEIEEIAGIKTTLSEAKFIRSDDSRDYNHIYIRLPLDNGRHYTETNGEGILFYDDFTPAVSKIGNVLYIGASDAIGRFNQFRDFHLANWWKKYFTAENLNSGVEFHNVYVQDQDKHQFVSCDLYTNDKKQLLLLRNFGVDHKNSTLTWNIPEGFKVADAIIDGEKFEFRSGEKLPFFEHMIAIYAEKI